jgi:hypothetical protein
MSRAANGDRWPLRWLSHVDECELVAGKCRLVVDGPVWTDLPRSIRRGLDVLAAAGCCQQLESSFGLTHYRQRGGAS